MRRSASARGCGRSASYPSSSAPRDRSGRSGFCWSLSPIVTCPRWALPSALTAPRQTRGGRLGVGLVAGFCRSLSPILGACPLCGVRVLEEPVTDCEGSLLSRRSQRSRLKMTASLRDRRAAVRKPTPSPVNIQSKVSDFISHSLPSVALQGEGWAPRRTRGCGSGAGQWILSEPVTDLILSEPVTDCGVGAW